ncbi:MAG: hypothetical protein Q7Q71_01675 [Verrucomicrobiota bacterium JB023]|nr:hypothetical protein [Verrucomicrobiota bacterium JB023]
MHDQTLRFKCPSCGIQLEVPTHLAGVTGPCPSCQAKITAPQLPPADADRPSVEPSNPLASSPSPAPTAYQPQEIAPPTPPKEAPSQPQAQPQASWSSQPGQPGQPAFPTEQPAPAPPNHPPAEPAAPAQAPLDPAPAAPAALAPEARAKQPEIKPLDEAPGAEPPNMTHEPPRKQQTTRRKSRAPWIILLLAFIALLIALIAGLFIMSNSVGIADLPFFKKANEAPPFVAPPSSSSPADSSTTNDEMPENPAADESTAPDPAAPAEDPDAPLDLDNLPIELEQGETSPDSSPLPPVEPLSDEESHREGETPLPTELDSTSSEAVQTRLENFLKAKTLSEREDILSLGTLEDRAMTKTLLSTPLPEPAAIAHYRRFIEQEESRIDDFFVVAWNGERNSPAQPITVALSQWAGQPAVIHGPAFGEAYRQDVRRFAAAPSEAPRTFHVIGRCVSQCFEEIPGAADLATLKIMSHPRDHGDSVKAYFKKKVVCWMS